MPLDAISLSALCEELKPALLGAKIDKLQQPERDMLLLSVHGQEGSRKLLIAVGSGNARVHFTQEKLENPAEPPMFCMLLRKHLVGARILSLTQPQHERMLLFELENRDELGDSAKKQLAVELIGRSANVILIGADGRIIDCLRRADFAGDAARRLLPGMIYRLPPRQDKRSFFETDSETRRAMIAAADRALPPDKWLLAQFSGLSPLVCRELAYRSGERYDTLPEQLDALEALIRDGAYTPMLLTQGGKGLDYSFLPIRQYGDAAENHPYDSFSALLDAFYAQRDRELRRQRRSRDLQRSLKTQRERLQRKLNGQREELRRTEDREAIQHQAELLTANLYRLKKGDRELVCEDYYEPDCPSVRIPLDPLKSPQQNAAALFKQARKLKAAREHLSVLIDRGEKELDYLDSVLDQLSRAESEREVSELRRELTETGYLPKNPRAKAERVKALAPLRYVSDDGLEILVGRSNVQNDELSGKTARRTDLWLHTQRVHGSHVILRCEGSEPPARSIEQAASLAAYHSQGREGGKLPVDYTMVRNVRKPSGALPGKVIYTAYKTILAEADEDLAKRLKQP